MMLRVTIQQYGWRYSHGKEMFRDFLESIIHPYQGMSVVIALLIF